MCAVSAIGDTFQKRWEDQWPYKYIPSPFVPASPTITPNTTKPFGTLMQNDEIIQLKNEIAALKSEMETIRIALLAAKKYDEETGQPHCEMDEKVALLKQIAHMVGVDLEEVFGK